MKTLLKSALVASLLIGTVSIGNAAGIGFNIGNVSLGFSDGYYDNGHHFHRWARHDDMVAWQHAHGDHYNGWRHDDKHHH
jgi:hypothetical protein